MKTEIIEADIVKWLAGNQWLFENGYLPKYHAVFCDPPYFLGSIVKRFGAKNAAPAAYGKDGRLARLSKGFMGKTWDGFESMEDYQEWVTTWATLLLSAVYPGAIGLFFGGTRTYHRLATGLEDAGWEIVDSFAYIYGSGFPKSHSVSDTHGTALKPAFEPVVVARAPRGNHTFLQLSEKFGSGAFNIDGGRIGNSSTPRKDPMNGNLTNAHMEMRPWMIQRIENGEPLKGDFDGNQGRWPSNLLLSHSVDCTDTTCTKDCPVRELGEQSGDLKGGGSVSGKEPSQPAGGAVYGRWERVGWEAHNDSGSAARFFYTAKCSSWERSVGLEEFEAKQIRTTYDQRTREKHGEDSGYPRQNTHPTVKPISITEYLSKLLLPPPLHNQPRRILVPFCGSGSEMIGAQLAGWDEITGIEREHEYTTIATARLKWWSQFKTYDAARKVKEPEPELNLPNGITLKQMEMFK